jgi:hypothetical protein
MGPLSLDKIRSDLAAARERARDLEGLERLTVRLYGEPSGGENGHSGSDVSSYRSGRTAVSVRQVDTSLAGLVAKDAARAVLRGNGGSPLKLGEILDQVAAHGWTSASRGVRGQVGQALKRLADEAPAIHRPGFGVYAYRLSEYQPDPSTGASVDPAPTRELDDQLRSDTEAGGEVE